MREASPFITDIKGVIAAAHLDGFRQANSKNRIAKEKTWLARLTKKQEPTLTKKQEPTVSYQDQKKDAEDAAAQFKAIQARRRARAKDSAPAAQKRQKLRPE